MGANTFNVQSTTPSRSGAGAERAQVGTPDGAVYTASYWDYLAFQGREYHAGPAASGTVVTGQTSLATTTPTLLLRVLDGTVAIPSRLHLAQAGTIAGGAISVLIEADNADRWSSGGTAATVLPARTDNPLTQGSTLYTGATAADGYGVQLWGALLGEDVSPAEGSLAGAIRLSLREGTLPLSYLRGPASYLIFTYAATTGPSWHWGFSWFEVPKADLP